MTPVFPLSVCHLPGDSVSLRVFEPRYLTMFSDIGGDDRPTFATVLIERGPEVGGGDHRFTLGVEVDHLEITSFENAEVGRQLHVTGVAGRVVEVRQWIDDMPYPCGEVREVEFPSSPANRLTDAASALTVLAQSVRSLLARHGVAPQESAHPAMAGLLTVASGRWFASVSEFRDVQNAFWAVCRCVPCGPLDRHALLRPDSLEARVNCLRRTVEHADEILGFSRSDGR